MRAPAPALLLALGLAGCAAIQGVALPAPAPPPVRPTEVAAAPPPRVTSPQPALPPAPAAPPPAPVPAPPAPPAPARPVAPPAETPPPPPPPAPPLVLAPQVSSEDERRIHGEAQRRIDGTERLVRQIDQRRLVEEQQQNLLTIQSFLVKAKEALSERDMQRAMTLADKAYLLADELFRRLR